MTIEEFIRSKYDEHQYIDILREDLTNNLREFAEIKINEYRQALFAEVKRNAEVINDSLWYVNPAGITSVQFKIT